MKVLITGSYGFIGYNVAMKLLKQGHTVIGLDRERTAISQKAPRIEALQTSFGAGGHFIHEECDLKDQQRVIDIFRRHKPQWVIHFAAQYAIAPLTDEVLQRYMWSNCEGFGNILWACKEVGVRRMIYASSTFVEDNIMSTHTYGATKVFNEHLANVFTTSYGMRCIGIRYGSTFGTWCRPDVGASLVCKRMFSGVEHPNKGGYLYKTAFLWSEDAVDGTLMAMQQDYENPHERFTLVMDDERYSLADFARLAHELTGIPYNPRQEPFKDSPGGGGVPVSAIQQMKTLMHWTPQVCFESAVAKFVSWYKDQWDAGKIK